jgi:hypothetical protein
VSATHLVELDAELEAELIELLVRVRPAQHLEQLIPLYAHCRHRKSHEKKRELVISLKPFIEITSDSSLELEQHCYHVWTAQLGRRRG